VEIKVPNINKGEIREKLFTAYQMAKNSNDSSTRNGAILCKDGWNLCAGCNHYVNGFGDLPEHHERPMKYSLIEHAERDVIYAAAKMGIQTYELTLVANWVACPDCARAIVLSGIACVVTHKQCMDRTMDRWKEMVALGLKIIRDGGVKLVIWDGEVGGVTNLNDGEVWSP
jgi:dCMP deaminase